MHAQQIVYDPSAGWTSLQPVGRTTLPGAQLVLVFAAPDLLGDPDLLGGLRSRYPTARIVSCSSGGEIAGEQVHEGRASITAIQFDRVRVSAAGICLEGADSSERIGRQIGEALLDDDLRHVLVFSEGLAVNGSALSAGINAVLPEGVGVTGGLAADGDRFQRTLVGLDDAIGPNQVVAVGLHGEALRVGMASLGGWELFGPDRVITRSEGNVLYELDGQPALDFYRSLLGPHAYGLPATGLFYPLNIRERPGDTGLVRTMLSVDEAARSVTFAGDVPEGRFARLMRADLDRLIEASGAAARRTVPLLSHTPAQVALLVSCIGRKLVLQKRAAEELQSARAVLGPQAVMCGYYSYGEISPLTPDARCELHNQTMTITTLTET